MRNLVLLLLLLLLAVAGVGWWYVISPGRSDLTPEPALVPRAERSPATVADGASPALDPVDRTGLQPSSSTSREVHSIDGTVVDRFGHPLRGERVILLRGDQDHPPAGTDLSSYVTALASSEGKFSLSFRTEGPWRLGAGPPGQPKIPPSEPRTLTRTTNVEVVLSGMASARVTFEPPLDAGLSVAVELLTLTESTSPTARVRPGGRAFEPGTPRELSAVEPPVREAQDDQEKIAAAEEDGDGDEGSEALEGSAPPRGSADEGARELGEDTFNLADRSNTAGDSSIRPPVESWRTVERRSLSRAEQTAGTVEFSSLPVGGILRLRLWVDRERIEGTRQFSAPKDSLTEIRILSYTTGPGAALNYLTSLQVPAAGENPPGVRWLD